MIFFSQFILTLEELSSLELVEGLGVGETFDVTLLGVVLQLFPLYLNVKLPHELFEFIISYTLG